MILIAFISSWYFRGKKNIFPRGFCALQHIVSLYRQIFNEVNRKENMCSDIKNRLFILMLMSSQANAVLYKNPVTETMEGQKSIGVSFVKMSRDLTSDAINGTIGADQTLLAADLSYGINDGSEIEFRIGLDDSELDGAAESSDGILLGAVFRSNIQLSNTDLKLGGFASLQSSSLSDEFSSTDVFVYEFGAGASKAIDKGLNLYGGGVLSFLDGTLSPDHGSAIDFEAADNFGAFVGLEKSLQNKMKIGVELNVIHQTGFAAYLEVPF